MFSLTSKKFYILLKPSWTAIKRKHRWCISWDLSYKRPQYKILWEYKLTKELFSFASLVFYQPNCVYPHWPSHYPFLNLHLLNDQQGSFLENEWKLDKSKMSTGEKLLQIFIKYRQSKKTKDFVQSFFYTLTHILEKDWMAFPSISHYLFLLSTHCAPEDYLQEELNLLVEKSIQNWKAGNKYPLEKLLEKILDRSATRSLSKAMWIEKLYQKEGNQVLPLLLTLITYRLNLLL